MARRIVLTMLALIGALLVTTVVPLGLITTGHERHSFQQDTILSARALAGVAENRLADRLPDPALGRVLAADARAGQDVAVYDPAAGWFPRPEARPRPSPRRYCPPPCTGGPASTRPSTTGFGWSSR